VPKSVAERADVIPALAECFREHGYEGASLALIGEATGLGKGSLYHFFPRGKEEMASAVLAEIDAWFEQHVFAPLRDTDPPEDGIAAMFDAVDAYFRSGRRVCIVGAFALGDTRDRFARGVRRYFARWIEALRLALIRSGRSAASAASISEEVVAGIQGAIVLARALDDPKAFARVVERLRRAALPSR
jgi:TetR/AcrR family transcriptional regulator, lmrAB and yxaGH operons repressor